MASETPPKEPPCDSRASVCPPVEEQPIRSENGQFLSDHDALCALVTSLQQSNRRWQIVVFPAMFAFVLLAIYGFYLIYSLVEDVDRMADSVYLNMGFVADRMNQISLNLDALTGSVRDISVNLDDLTGTVTAMNVTMLTISTRMETLPPMLVAIEDISERITSLDSTLVSLDGRVGTITGSMQSMNHQMGAITVATQSMSGNMSGLNQNIGRPMNFMNSIMPW
jgi:methyl-accepting chemotaxis protein